MSKVIKTTKRSRPESGHSVILLIKIFYVFSNRLRLSFSSMLIKWMIRLRHSGRFISESVSPN